jgi:hypothetical protein
MTPRRTVGDDIEVRATLYLNGQKENLTNYTIKAALVQPDKATLAVGTSIVDATIIDAANGVVSAMWPRATTGQIVPGLHLVEFEATIGALKTTYERAEILIDPGAIT